MNQFLLPLTFVLAFVAVATLAQALANILLARRSRTQRVNRRLTLLESGMGHKEVYETLVRRPKAPQFHSLFFLRAYDKAAGFLRQAGLSMSPLAMVGTVAAVGLGLALAANLVMRLLGVGGHLPETVMSVAGAFVLTGLAFWIWVSGRRQKRAKILEEQMPLALDIVVRSLHAGHPVVSALQLVTEEMGDPIGSEFGLIVDETTYGFELREALANFARRTGSEDAHFFAVSVAIQTETGGNLAEILHNLAMVVRSRITLGKRIKALASEGRMSAIILSGLPIFLIGSIALTQPQFYTSKFSDPIFWPTVTVILVIYGLGQLMMRRIVNFKY
ncbi:type II secretion system F family protein [Phenylobacterium sp. Root700]|uniref:type II secretion system F family protein n=1 Tax=Phenylobacterium sp. Root700 TaxID=1736591 RepID=UPI0007001686|nr:type II secretion system F family protein [Phenylobacterium sp. Root700]KRB52655.1 hypothetical protein ASE02_11775 [Phenylobacterium sp. Root700]